MFTFLPGPFLVQFSGPFYLSTDNITILSSIAFLVIGTIIIVILFRLPQDTLVKFIDNLSYFISGFAFGISIYPIFNHFRNLVFKKE